MHAQIKCISYHLPEPTLSNEDINSMFPEWSVDKISEKTGIRNRHIASKDTFSSDLAVNSAEKLFDEYGIDRKSIDFLLFCTQSPDYYLPTTACIIQDRLGLPLSCGALDFNLGCSGYIYGLSLAKGLIQTRQAKNILFITAETYSKFIHPKDKSNRTIFGDASSSTLLSANASEDRILDFVFGTDGRGYKNLIVRTGSLREPNDTQLDQEITDDYGNTRTENSLFMDGQEVFGFTLRSVPKLVDEILLKNNATKDQVDLFILHQANAFMLEALRKRMGIPKEKFFVYLEDCGNTVSSTIPIALREALNQGRAKVGDTILLAGFGVGYSWAGTLIKV